MKPVRFSAIDLYNSLNVGDKISWKNIVGDTNYGIIIHKNIEFKNAYHYYHIQVVNNSLAYPQTQETFDKWKSVPLGIRLMKEFESIRKVDSLNEVKPVRFDPNTIIDNINKNDRISFNDYKNGEKCIGTVIDKGIQSFENTQKYYFVTVRFKLRQNKEIYVNNHLIYPQNLETLEIWNNDDALHTSKLMKEFESIRKIK